MGSEEPPFKPAYEIEIRNPDGLAPNVLAPNVLDGLVPNRFARCFPPKNLLRSEN